MQFHQIDNPSYAALEIDMVRLLPLVDPYLSTDKISAIRSFTFENQSGHYKPDPEDLNPLINMLKKLNFKLIKDKSESQTFQNRIWTSRKVELVPN